MFRLLALVLAAVFTGAAVYLYVAEQPARLALDNEGLLTQWKPAYKRGFAMQASLAVLAALLSFAEWWITREPLWLVGSVTIFSNWPYTLLVIMPVNRQLDATPSEQASAETRRLISGEGGRSPLGATSVASSSSKRGQPSRLELERQQRVGSKRSSIDTTGCH
jgi:Domain of unknown function (DUF1772)